jgi:hypothetical protein
MNSDPELHIKLLDNAGFKKDVVVREEVGMRIKRKPQKTNLFTTYLLTPNIMINTYSQVLQRE